MLGVVLGAVTTGAAKIWGKVLVVVGFVAAGLGVTWFIRHEGQAEGAQLAQNETLKTVEAEDAAAKQQDLAVDRLGADAQRAELQRDWTRPAQG